MNTHTGTTLTYFPIEQADDLGLVFLLILTVLTDDDVGRVQIVVQYPARLRSVPGWGQCREKLEETERELQGAGTPRDHLESAPPIAPGKDSKYF